MTNKKKESKGMRGEGRVEWRRGRRKGGKRRGGGDYFLLGEKRLTLMNTSLQKFFKEISLLQHPRNDQNSLYH